MGDWCQLDDGTGISVSATEDMEIELTSAPRKEPPRPDTPGYTPSTTARETSPEESCEESNEIEAQSLPPVDSGKDAWLFLVACFMIECLVWGKRSCQG